MFEYLLYNFDTGEITPLLARCPEEAMWIVDGLLGILDMPNWLLDLCPVAFHESERM